MAVTVNIARAKRMTTKGLAAGLVPMLWGPPAIGKSQIVRQIAQENNLFLIDERLSDCDPTDLKGFPYTDHNIGKGGYLPMDTFPIVGDALPHKPGSTKEKPIQYDGWLLFLDELTNADDDVKKAAYKLVLDRMVGQKHLHEKCFIVCAGNDINDGAMAGELGTAMQSRLMHIVVDMCFNTWMGWAIENGIDQRIRDYLNFTKSQNDQKLYTFRPDHTDKTFASPRTWEFADKLLKTHDFDDEDMYTLQAGVLSDGVAAQFMEFCLVYKDLPKIDTILQGPEYATMPDGLSSIFAMCGTVAAALTVANAPKLMVYIKRMPPEFIIITLMDAIKRDPTLKQDPQIRTWAMTHGHELF